MRSKGSGKTREKRISMTKPAMMDWALRLLRLLNERKVLTSRIVAEEFGVNIRTAQRYLLYLSDLPCVVVDEEKHTYSLTSDYVLSDKILNASEMALVCALIDYATHVFGKEHSRFLAGLKNRIFRMPDVYRIVRDEAIDMEKVAGAQLLLERHIKAREAVSFTYRKSGKRYVADPYRILYSDGFWYLVAVHDGVVKKFLLDFIEGIRSMGRPCRELPEDIRQKIDGAQTIWFTDRPPDRVTAEFDAEVAHFFERRNVLPRQEIVGRAGDGKIRVSFDVHSEMELREHLARWMPCFRVVSPERYRSYILGLCREVTERNAGSGEPTG